MKSIATGLTAVLAGLGLVCAILFAVWGAVWWLWCAIVPQLWATGPEAFIRPNFWLFVGVWVLVSIIGKSIFGGDSK